MFTPRNGNGHRTIDGWREEKEKHWTYRSTTNTQARASALLHRRAVVADAAVRGLPTPFPLPGVRQFGRFSHSEIPRGIPSSAHMGPGNKAMQAPRFESGVRSRGSVGVGELKEELGGGKGVKEGNKPSTFFRLWQEAKHEKGYLGMASVCLLLSSSANLMAPTIMAKAIDRASKRGGRSGGWSSAEMCVAGRPISDKAFVLGALGVFAAGSLASWGRIYSLAMASAGIAGRLRSRLFAALLLQEKDFFDERRAGELAPVMAEDVDVSSTVFTERMASILRSLNSSINASVALLSISPTLTLVSMSTVPLVGSVAMLYYKHVRRLSMELRNLDGEAQAFAQARLANVRTVRAFANEAIETKRFQQMIYRASGLRTKEASAQGFFKGGLFGMVGASLMAVLWVGGSRVGDGRMTAGQLTSFATYTGMVGLGFSGLATSNANITRGLASAERVFSLVDRIPVVPVDKGLEPAGDVLGDVEFRDVWFHYKGRDKAVLQGVNLKLTRGNVLALTGPSGEGKSTLASLINRLYEPNQGSITLDDVDIAALNPSWLRRKIGVVDQEPVLFAGSIGDNIRYGVPSASDEDVHEAAQQANAHDFITNFPEGYDTLVGDEGRLLSGGQKQRVAIARAILKNPPLLILDEATSALDAESERLVSEAIDRVVTSRTVLVIAHRQSTVKKADSVAVLQDGVVAESGSYTELMAKPDGLLATLMEGGKRDIQ